MVIVVVDDDEEEDSADETEEDEEDSEDDDDETEDQEQEEEEEEQVEKNHEVSPAKPNETDAASDELKAATADEPVEETPASARGTGPLVRIN